MPITDGFQLVTQKEENQMFSILKQEQNYVNWLFILGKRYKWVRSTLDKLHWKRESGLFSCKPPKKYLKTTV